MLNSMEGSKPIFILLIWFSVSMISCNRELDNHDRSALHGTYTGNLTVRYSNQTYTYPCTINFNQNLKTYHCSTKGSGNFEIEDGTKIQLEDGNFWTANFDWNLILDGIYNYSLNGDSLTISAHKNNVGYYEYQLEKQK